jgi:hypothetical protein
MFQIHGERRQITVRNGTPWVINEYIRQEWSFSFDIYHGCTSPPVTGTSHHSSKYAGCPIVGVGVIVSVASPVGVPVTVDVPTGVIVSVAVGVRVGRCVGGGQGGIVPPGMVPDCASVWVYAWAQIITIKNAMIMRGIVFLSP